MSTQPPPIWDPTAVGLMQLGQPVLPQSALPQAQAGQPSRTTGAPPAPVPPPMAAPAGPAASRGGGGGGPVGVDMGGPYTLPRMVAEQQRMSARTESPYIPPGISRGQNILDDVLSSAKQARIQNYVRQEEEAAQSRADFYSYAQNVLNDPNLTESAKAQVRQMANQALYQQADEQLKKTPDPKGVGAFFRKVMEQATGGPMPKARQPIGDMFGQVARIAQDPNNTVGAWRDIANSALAQRKQELGLGENATGQQVAMAAQQVAQDMGLLEQLGPEATRQWIIEAAAFLPRDASELYQQEQDRRKTEYLRQMFGQGAPTTEAPPSMPREPLPPTELRMGPGAGAEVPIPRQMDVRPADSGQAEAPPMLDLRNPIARGVLKDLGYKIDDPATFYDTQAAGEWRPHPNVRRNPIDQYLYDARTNERLANQNLVPYDQIRTPSVSQNALLAGYTDEDNPQYGWYRVPRAGGPATPIPVESGQVLRAPSVPPLEEVAVPGGGTTRLPRPSAIGTPKPPTREETADAAVTRVIKDTGGDLIWALEKINDPANYPDLAAADRARARENIETSLSRYDLSARATAGWIQAQRARARERKAQQPAQPGGAATPPPSAQWRK